MLEIDPQDFSRYAHTQALLAHSLTEWCVCYYSGLQDPDGMIAEFQDRKLRPRDRRKAKKAKEKERKAKEKREKEKEKENEKGKEDKEKEKEKKGAKQKKETKREKKGEGATTFMRCSAEEVSLLKVKELLNEYRDLVESTRYEIEPPLRAVLSNSAPVTTFSVKEGGEEGKTRRAQTTSGPRRHSVYMPPLPVTKPTKTVTIAEPVRIKAHKSREMSESSNKKQGRESGSELTLQEKGRGEDEQRIESEERKDNENVNEEKAQE